MSTALVLPMIWAKKQAMNCCLEAAEERWQPAAVEVKAEVAFYRKYTEGMLRRYMRLAMETGRVPSLLGQEMFRGRVTSYRVRSFEDVVIFVYDVEKCLERLDGMSQQLVVKIALQEYTQGETAALLRMSLRTVVRKYGWALDQLTEIFLENRMLEPLLDTLCQVPRGRGGAASN